MSRKTTEEILANALMDISNDKNIDKITIRELVERCGLSSQTFYNHFSDKYEFMQWIHKSFGESLVERMSAGEITFYELMRENLAFYAERASFMLNALTNTHGSDAYWLSSSENAIEALSSYIKKQYALKELPEMERLHLRMFAYSLTEICAYWALNGMKIPLDEMVDYIIGAMPASLQKYLK